MKKRLPAFLQGSLCGVKKRLTSRIKTSFGNGGLGVNYRKTEVLSYSDDGRAPARESRDLAIEAPLRVSVDNGGDYYLMRTPGDDRDLAAGFLFSLGAIDSIEEIAAIKEDESGKIEVKLREKTKPHRMKDPAAKPDYSGELWGSESPTDILNRLDAPPPGPEIPIRRLLALPALLRERQRLFSCTGCTHAIGLFDADGTFLVVREDISRHNALDKAIGAHILKSGDTGGIGIFVSGRISLEITLKATRAGIGLIAGISAATSGAVDAADRLGMTLCGFVRGREATIYTHPQRILPCQAPGTRL